MDCICRWTVADAKLGRHTLVPGTVLPADSSLFLCAEPRKCRERLDGDNWATFMQQLNAKPIQQARHTPHQLRDHTCIGKLPTENQRKWD